MRQTLTTFVLLLVLFICTFYIVRGNSNNIISYTTMINDIPIPMPNVNKKIVSDYDIQREEIEKYRIGTPRFEDYPEHVKTYYPKPPSFIPGYRQPIDGIVPGYYKSTLDPTNVMFPDMYIDGCKENCMDMQKDYYSNLLN